MYVTIMMKYDILGLLNLYTDRATEEHTHETTIYLCAYDCCLYVACVFRLYGICEYL